MPAGSVAKKAFCTLSRTKNFSPCSTALRRFKARICILTENRRGNGKHLNNRKTPVLYSCYGYICILLNDIVMKIKWGALVTDGRGKIGGQVASRNKSGAYMKNKVTPSNPRTVAQQAQRALMSSLSQAWRGLTAAARDQWRAAVDSFPTINEFGDVVILSGSTLYNRLNLNLAKVGVAPIGVPPLPAGAGLTNVTGLVLNPTTVSFDMVEGVPAGQTALISATAPMSPGINNFKTRLRNITTSDASGGATVAMFAEYGTKFGQPISGTKIGFSIVLVNNSTGETGTPIYFTGIVF